MRHQTISFIKSGLRLIGYVMLGSLSLLFWSPEAILIGWFLGWTVLVLSEVVGVVEEIGHE